MLSLPTMKMACLACLIAAMAVPGLTTTTGAESPASPSAPDARPADVKSYLLDTLGKIEIAADGFVRDAMAYDAIVTSNSGDPGRAFAAAPAETTRLIDAMREEYKAMDSFGYETIEGIVAGVPVLADFDIYLDSGVPQDQSGGGTPVGPVVVPLPGGGKIDREGSLFTYLIEPMLWGSNKKLTVAADLDRDGKVGPRESLPRADMLPAIATHLRSKLRELRAAAVAWKPSTADYLSAIITMTPTLSGYFDDWKESRYAPETSGRFTAVSRVSDMRGIMFSVAVMYSAVRKEVASKDVALANSIQQGFDGILAFIDRVEEREKKAGGSMTGAEVDELAEQAKQKADKLVPQVEQAAAILEIQAAGA